ncbi:E3 SUMO-protein ligase ZBED1-like isoform X1 [Anguilla rostrata]|uniref:E3 SUMO-protein ligase ZBED1-like isoform X1 n=1 Tax=Anguilla rostrata TaxID=7938 RepID=UPI0030CF4F99
MSGSETECKETVAKDEEIVPKKGHTTSVIWKSFGYLKSDQAQTSIRCKICRRPVLSRTGNTTNLFHHLKRHHPTEHSESLSLRYHASVSLPSSSSQQPSPTASQTSEVRQPTILSAFSAITPYEKKSKRYKEITSAITYCIAKDMMPISTVEKQGFKKLMSVIDAKYALPGRKYFSKKSLPQLYAECRGKLEEQLRNVTHFTTTTDMWSSRTSEPYMSLTIHYVDKEWNLQSRCLQTAYSLDDHTAEIIAQGLVEALASWGLSEDRQVCITTDSGANIVKAVSLNNWTRLQCFGHRLHRAIGKLLTIK